MGPQDDNEQTPHQTANSEWSWSQGPRRDFNMKMKFTEYVIYELKELYICRRVLGLHTKLNKVFKIHKIVQEKKTTKCAEDAKVVK